MSRDGWTPDDAKQLRRCADGLDRIAKALERAFPRPTPEQGGVVITMHPCSACGMTEGHHAPHCHHRLP